MLLVLLGFLRNNSCVFAILSIPASKFLCGFKLEAFCKLITLYILCYIFVTMQLVWRILNLFLCLSACWLWKCNEALPHIFTIIYHPAYGIIIKGRCVQFYMKVLALTHSASHRVDATLNQHASFRWETTNNWGWLKELVYYLI